MSLAEKVEVATRGVLFFFVAFILYLFVWFYPTRSKYKGIVERMNKIYETRLSFTPV